MGLVRFVGLAQFMGLAKFVSPTNIIACKYHNVHKSHCEKESLVSPSTVNDKTEIMLVFFFISDMFVIYVTKLTSVTISYTELYELYHFWSNIIQTYRYNE